MSADSSTIVMSPPPRAGVGSMFMAGLKSGMGCRLPADVTTSACARDNLIELRIVLKTEARATADNSVPTMSSKEISDTAAWVNCFLVRTFCERRLPAEGLSELSSKIGLFRSEEHTSELQ